MFFMRFSAREIKEIVKAWLAVSFVFAIAYSRESLFSSAAIPTLALFMGVSLGTVGLGFLLHELAHKYLAQKYGAYAEFRAFNGMLVMAVILAAAFGFVFAAPGAVFIQGRINVARNGRISAIGPFVNILLALAFLAMSTVVSSPILQFIAQFGFSINALLALFNMLPFWVLDGQKVWAWNKGVWTLLAGSAFLLYMFSFAT